MNAVFFFPLALTVVGVIYFLVTDVEVRIKLFAAAVAASSFALQFPLTDPPVHFLVPLAIQIGFCLFTYRHWQLAD